jgi:hypothetical protein
MLRFFGYRDLSGCILAGVALNLSISGLYPLRYFTFDNIEASHCRWEGGLETLKHPASGEFAIGPFCWKPILSSAQPGSLAVGRQVGKGLR